MLPLTIEASGHAGHDGAGEIPRRNHRADAERNVGQRVALARQLHGRLGFGEAQGLARVELAEIDGLGNVGIGLEPVLRNFEHQPGHEFELALAHHIGDAEQERGALLDRSAAPVGERLRRGLHGGLDVLIAGFLVNADHFRRLGGIDGTNLVGGLDALAADDQVVLAAQLATHFLDGGAHLAHVLFFGEIDECFIFERAFVQGELADAAGLPWLPL